MSAGDLYAETLRHAALFGVLMTFAGGAFLVLTHIFERPITVEEDEDDTVTYEEFYSDVQKGQDDQS